MEIAIIPAIVLRPFCLDPSRQLRLNLAASALALVVFFAAFPPALLARIPHVCLFRSVLGIPCPGCGITTSLFAVAHFDIAAAVLANPAGLLIAASLLMQAAINSWIFFQQREAPAVTRILESGARATLAVLLVVWTFRVIVTLNS